MAPIELLTGSNDASHHLVARSLAKRAADLAPNDAQKVTLGVIGAYVVVIALLWCVILYPL